MGRGIHSFHPYAQFLYYTGATALVMLYKHPVFLFSGAVILIIFNFQLDRGKTLKKWLVMYFFLAGFFLVLNPFLNHRGTHILFYLGANPIMFEAIMSGIISFLSILTILILFTSYNLVITAERFLFIFSRWLPQWALLTMISMRFVPLLRRRLQEIENVQRGKGLSVTEGKLKEKVKNGVNLLQILLTWSLDEAVQTADSMSARGYGMMKRSTYNPYKMKGKDWLAISYLLIFAILGAIGGWLGDGVLSIYPVMETLSLHGREWFYLIVFILFIGSPLMIEGKEEILWRFWKRNI